MTDPTFESLLTGQLRAYAEAGVRPIDRFAIAEETIAGGRALPRWRRGWSLAPTRGNRVLMPLLVGLLLAALAGGALLVGSRLLAPRTPPHTYVNELVSAPDLSLPMAHPALVPLLDGRVLVIGDDGDGGGTGTRALVYDPATGVSAPTGPLVSSDSLGVESTVRLKDGRVLVIANTFADPQQDATQVFDPSTRRFTRVGSRITPRTGAAVALLPDGHVLFAGGTPSGQDGATSSAELFDPDTLAFSPTGSMGTSRSMHSMAVLPDGRVFVSPGESRTTVETYDPRTGTFSGAGTMSSYFHGNMAIALPDGRVVVLGGSSLSGQGFAEVWDPTSLTFSPGCRPRPCPVLAPDGGMMAAESDLPGPVTSATLLDDGRILLAGEQRIGEQTASWSGTYDPTTGVTTPIQTTRAWDPRATRLADGRVLVVGGLTDGRTDHGEGGMSAPAVTTVEIFQ
jgi:hypothetical protein